VGQAGAVIRFQAPQLPPADAVSAYFALAEERRWYSNRGPCHELLVERLQDHLGGGLQCVPVNNATLGLLVGLRALAGEGDAGRREVLMPSFTFAAAMSAVRWAGFAPVLLDVEPDGWHLDPAALATALEQRGDRVAAVLAASTFGVPPAAATTAAWEAATRAAGVPLLVDSAAGFGAHGPDGRELGGQGDIEVFSFHATKPFAIGEGGLLTTADPELAARATRLANFGFEDGVVRGDVGLNAKLPEWSAATALAVLDGYDGVLAARRERAEALLERITPLGFRRQALSAGAAWQFVPVLAETAALRDAVLARAREDGIEVRTYFDVPLHRMPAFAGAPRVGDLAVTEDLAARVLSLPMANDLSAAAIDAIATSLAAAAAAPASR
jgi:dTDP-4-amino-4,6-dideoxygalactose transaminase